MIDDEGPTAHLAARQWRKARCNSGACIEVSLPEDRDEEVLIRDTKQSHLDTGYQYLRMTIDEFPVFVAELCNSTSTDPADTGRAVRVEQHADGNTLLHSADGSTILSFDPQETAAFAEGARQGEFRLPQLT